VEHASTTDGPFRFPPGSVLPDVTLPDQDGNARKLSELPGGDPLVLHTYRGWFCPKERTFFRTVMQPLQEVAEVGYIRMVSVSVEPQFELRYPGRHSYRSRLLSARSTQPGRIERTSGGKSVRPHRTRASGRAEPPPVRQKRAFGEWEARQVNLGRRWSA
jgi:AhpC/TSA family